MCRKACAGRKRFMNDRQWWLAGETDASGPYSTDEMRARLAKAGDAPSFVWRDGMAEWAEAGGLPEFSGPAAASAPEGPETPALAAPAHSSIKARLRHELIEYAIVSAYLYVVLGALIAFKSSVMKSDGVLWSHYGLAVIKALILGKFMLLLQAVRIGERRQTLYLRVLQKAAVFVALLFVLNVAEEFLVGKFHGKSWAETAADMSTLLSQPFIVAFLMFLSLLPYFAFMELSRYFGEGVLRAAFMSRRDKAGS